jgi:hypothetical protein
MLMPMAIGSAANAAPLAAKSKADVAYSTGIAGKPNCLIAVSSFCGRDW